MEMVRKYLREKYQISNYQIAQLEYVFKTFASELSKMLIMGILFHRFLSLYLFALCVLLCLRNTTGGLHFYTYAGCLACSILYMGLAICILPHLTLPFYGKICALLASLLVCWRVGPVVSKYRREPSPERFRHFRNLTCIFILIYISLLFIIPENPYTTVGFWVIILHSLQLTAAKIRKKGECRT